MAEYIPLFMPGDEVSMTASAAITAGQLVAVSGDGTIAKTAAASAKVVGVAAQDAAASGDIITVYCRGAVHRSTSSGGSTAGDALQAAANGAVASHTVGTNDANTIGVALTTAADTASLTWMEV